MKKVSVPATVQGEGNYEAARRYDKSASDFAKSGKVATSARKAKPLNPEEAAALSQAERVGLAHSQGEDPAPNRAPNTKKASAKLP